MVFSKKGELTTSELIGIIILLASVAIIIFIYFQINWIGQIDDAVCHESVILRGTLPQALGAKNLVPLKCQTEKICIRGDKLLFGQGDCSEEYFGAKDVNEKDAKDVNDINRVVAQEMLSCWQMMGEGKLSIFPQSFWVKHKVPFAEPESSCVICTRIALDEETLNSIGVDINNIDVENYMKTHKAPNQEVSYYDYFIGENGKTKVEETAKDSLTKEYGGVNKDEEVAIIFMQIGSDDIGETIKIATRDTGIVIGSGAYVLGAKSASKFLITKVGGILVAGWQAITHTQSWASRNVVAGYCGDISYGDESRESCSVVRVVPYNLEGISEYCNSIESIS